MDRPEHGGSISVRRLRSPLPLALLVGAYAVLVQASGANQASHYALVRALAAGTPIVDRWREETPDTSFTDGHFYSVKAPGLAFGTLPFYGAADAAGLLDLARRAGESVASGEAPDGRGRRAALIRAQRGETWLLGLWAVVLPAALLLWLVRSLAERVAPGRGTLAAVGLGAGTLVLPYATMLYAHVLAATLALAAFAVLWRERDGPPRTALVAAAGVLAGLAAIVEYPAALAGAIVGLYALARADVRRPVRAAAYAGGVLIGGVPLALYNLWAFGSVTHLSYVDAVAVEGRSGHDVLGLNEEGLFGVAAPDPRAALDLLLAPKGLITLTPIVVVALAGVVALHRAGRRAEAWTIGGVAGTTLLYNAGYYLPYGGDVPGPRFLLVALPFLAVGLAAALRRWPGASARAGRRLGVRHGGGHGDRAAAARAGHGPLGHADRRRGFPVHRGRRGRRRPRLARAAALPRADRRRRRRGAGRRRVAAPAARAGPARDARACDLGGGRFASRAAPRRSLRWRDAARGGRRGRRDPRAARHRTSRGFSGAGATGLEPATSGVTGRRSNQLSYAPVLRCARYRGDECDRGAATVTASDRR